MNQLCKLCKQEMAQPSHVSSHTVTSGICDACLSLVLDASTNREILEAIDAPVLLMQGNPRQVITANNKALELFEKELPEVEAHRGGQVFDCVHSFTPAGCGLDANCEHCTIKNAIVDTFVTSTPRRAVAATLQVKKADGLEHRTLQVSTERVGELALVRIERFERE